jgi:anti-anti-sigma regulatory factor
MTCKIVRLVERDHLVLLHISGHLQEVHVSMIEELIVKETDPVILDLAEVTLVDREAVRFLAACDVKGIGLRNCPEFIREWMSKM